MQLDRINCSVNSEPADIFLRLSSVQSTDSLESISYMLPLSPSLTPTPTGRGSYMSPTLDIPHLSPRLSQSNSFPDTPITPLCRLSSSPRSRTTQLTRSRSANARVSTHARVPTPAHQSPTSQPSFSSQSLRNIFTKVQKKVSSKNTKSTEFKRYQSEPVSHLAITSKWRPNLDFILDDEELLIQLIHFMVKQYNEENVLFLEALSRLECTINELVMSDAIITSATEYKINHHIQRIYSTYITKDAHRQVNLSYQCWTEIMSHYDDFQALSLPQKADMFIQSGNEIATLVRLSVLGGFYRSDEFQSIAHSRNIFTNNHHAIQRRLSPVRSLRLNPVHMSDDKVHFDRNSTAKGTNDNKYMISSKGINNGCHEWKIKIMKMNGKRQEFGVVSTLNTNIAMNECGIEDTPMFGARVVYGCNKSIRKRSNFYYASYNKDNSVRCAKDLSALEIHQREWREGDVVTVLIDLSKGMIQFNLNGNKVRKKISIERNTIYYPIILYSG
eukprot:180436_1